MKKFFLSIIISMVLLFNLNAQTTSSAVGSVNDTVKICAGQSVKLLSKLGQHVAYDFENGLPTGFTMFGGTITDSICNNPAPSNIAWLYFFDPGNRKQIIIDNPNVRNIYRVDFDIKLSDFSDVCVNPFILPNLNQAVFFKFITGTLYTGYNVADSVASGNSTCSGSQYNWKRCSRTTTSPKDKVFWYQGNPNANPGSYGIDNIDVWYYGTPDSTIWRCVEYPNFKLNKDTTALLPGQPGTTIHMIATTYKDGIEYPSVDTLKVVTSILPIPISYGITGNQLICENTTETYIVHSQYAETYQWIKPSNFVGTSIDSTISLTFGSNISTNTQEIIVKLFNSCASTSDTIFVKKRDIFNLPICYIDYDLPSNKNKIVWTSATNPLIDSVFVYREISSQFVKIGAILYNTHEFIDYSSNPPVQSYKYIISATNLCNKEGNKSNSHRTISLQPISSGGIYYFNWTSYEGLTFNKYSIYGLDASNNSFLVDSVNANQLTYNYINPNPAYVSFYVGIDITGCYTKTTLRIKSNLVLSPNVGIYENQNTSFRLYPNPVKDNLTIEFFDNKENHVYILNSLGQIIFETICKEKININTGNLERGIYFVKIDKENRLQKFIK